MQHFPKEYKKLTRLEESNKSKIFKLKLEFGNTHRILLNPPLTKKKKYPRKHSCVVYVKPLSSKINIHKIIKKVVFEMHPSFKKDEEVRYHYPYKFACKVWGYFDIPITVYFQDWVGVESIDLSHELCISGEGEKKVYVFEIPKKRFPPGVWKTNPAEG